MNVDHNLQAQSTSGISDGTLKDLRLLGTYSVNENRMYYHDDSQLKYICPKYLDWNSVDEVEMDLCKAFKKNQMPDYAIGERMQNTLRWILDNKDCLVKRSKTPRLSMDFVGEHHLFVNMLIHPCMGEKERKFKENFAFFATEFQGTVYLMECSGEMVTSTSPDKEKCSYSWAYKFEQYLSGANGDEGFHANVEHHVAIGVQLGKTKLLVDALQNVADETKLGARSPGAYFILKHHNFLTNEYTVNAFRDKMIAAWARGVVSGSEFLILGYRNKGVVKKIEKIAIRDLPQMHSFQPESSLKYLSKTLDFIKSKVSKKPGAVYKVFKAENKIHCTEQSSSMAAHDVPVVLPKWYTNNVFA